MIRNFFFLFYVFGWCSLSQAQKVELLYFTDAHQIFPLEDVTGGRGGVARLKTLVVEQREANPGTLVIHGGDLCGGVLFGGMYKGFPMIEAFNEIGIDVCNFGQHEFDFGTENTLNLLSKSKSQWFSTNLKNRDGEVFGNLPSYLETNIDGIRIIFIGLTDAMNTTARNESVIQEDLVVAVSHTIEKLNPLSYDFLVVLSQTDLETNRKLLDQFPDIDLILTEEQYELESNVFYKGTTPVVSTAGNMSSVAKIGLKKGAKLHVEIIPLDQNITADLNLREMELYYKRDMELKLAKPISKLEIPLHFREGITRESAACNLVTDAFREYHQADVGLINGGGIRADVSPGKFTLKSARSLLPFGNKICKIIIKSYDLKQFIKKFAISKGGQLLHVSGLKYKYSPLNDDLLVEWKGKELGDEELLTVALNSYLLDQMDGDFEILIDRTSPEAIEDYEALRIYCEKRDVLHPLLEGRLSVQSQ